MSDYTTTTPEWAVQGNSVVMGGIEGIKDTTVGNINPALASGKLKPKRKLVPTEDEFVEGVSLGDRTMLARAITLIESNSPKHFGKAQRVLQRLLPKTGRALRIGITGVPGAGKSTLIEAFGNMLCDEGHKVAVLAVDPTSSITRGSILGDKTRMGTLSRRPEAFIRPSPAYENNSHVRLAFLPESGPPPSHLSPLIIPLPCPSGQYTNPLQNPLPPLAIRSFLCYTIHTIQHSMESRFEKLFAE